MATSSFVFGLLVYFTEYVFLHLLIFFRYKVIMMDFEIEKGMEVNDRNMIVTVRRQ